MEAEAKNDWYLEFTLSEAEVRRWTQSLNSLRIQIWKKN